MKRRTQQQWILEKYQPLDRTMRLPLDEVITGRWEALQWVKIMNLRSLEKALVFGKRRKDEGLTIRLRNLVTGDIIMGDIL